MKTKLFTVLFIVLILIVSLCSCTNNTPSTDETTTESTAEISTDIQSEKETVKEYSEVTAIFSADAETFNSYETFVVDETEYSTKIMFIAEGLITDFSFDSLLVTDVDDNGNMTFDSQSLYTLDELKEDKPLEVTLTFYGDTPAYAISYKDATGETKNFTVTLSGEDGSVILTEF